MSITVKDLITKLVELDKSESVVSIEINARMDFAIDDVKIDWNGNACICINLSAEDYEKARP